MKTKLMAALVAAALVAGIMAGCNGAEEPSSVSSAPPPESVSSPADSVPSSSDAPEASSSADAPDPSDAAPSSSLEGDAPSSIAPPPPSSLEETPAKIVFVTSDDERLQFTSSTEAVGTAEELEDCKNALDTPASELGLLVVYNEGGVREYTDEFIDRLLGRYRRRVTSWYTIDEIREQHPSALTRGTKAMAFYDQEGNRLWVFRGLGNLIRFELEDSGNTLVFGIPGI